MSSPEQRPVAAWLLDTYGVAKLLGISDARVRQLSDDDPRFPAPLRTFGRHKVYWAPEIEAYKAIPRPPALPRKGFQ